MGWCDVIIWATVVYTMALVLGYGKVNIFEWIIFLIITIGSHLFVYILRPFWSWIQEVVKKFKFCHLHSIPVQRVFNLQRLYLWTLNDHIVWIFAFFYFPKPRNLLLKTTMIFRFAGRYMLSCRAPNKVCKILIS